MKPNNALEQWLRPGVRGLEAYAPEPAGPPIRLDANESPYDVPAELKKQIWQAFQQQAWNRYPDSTCLALRRALAELEGVMPDNIVVGNGSDEIIRDLLIAFGGPGTKTVIPAPTFSMYRLLTLIVGGEPVEIALKDDWSLPLPQVLAALNQPESRLLFLATPNNPTGNCFPPEQIERILQGTDRLVVVDEAYRWFGGQSMIPLLSRYPNLAVLCTLSKTSLAGLRVGYLVANPAWIDIVQRIRLPYNLDLFAQTVAEHVVRQREFWQKNVRLIKAERERLAAQLQALPGLEVFPSQANFIFVRLAEVAAARQELAQAGVAVRGFVSPERIANCLRITVGTPAENDRCVQGLARALARK